MPTTPPQSVETLHETTSEDAQSAGGSLETPVARKVPQIVGELDYPHAEVVKQLEPLEIPLEHGGILEAVDQTQPTGSLRILQLHDAPDLGESLGMSGQLAFPVSNTRYGVVETLVPLPS